MFIVNECRQIVGDLAEYIARLESLLADLERYSNGELPSERELDAAPLLDPFGVIARPSVRLIGGNHGHPYAKGHAVQTTEVWVMAAELGWARTYSRLYRLGRPLLPGDAR